MSIFSLYKVIKVDGKIKLSTITDPYSGNQDFLLRGSEQLSEISKSFSHRFNKEILSKEYGVLALETASPSYRSSWRGILSDVFDLKRLNLDIPLLELLTEFKQDRLKLDFQMFSELTYPISRESQKERLNGAMGQLSLKEEAAGKIRVFALVDVWTQSSLKPLHEMIFSFLRKLPNDGTFDQHASVLRCAEKVEKAGKSFGYDLSAATDRLPIDLQVAVLSPIIGSAAANA
jgi:hypothetical protein